MSDEHFDIALRQLARRERERAEAIGLRRLTPYHLPNTEHWLKCASSLEGCPILPGDTRIPIHDEVEVPAAEAKRIAFTSLTKTGRSAFELHDLIEKAGRIFLPGNRSWSL